MRRRVLAVVVAASALTALVPAVSQARQASKAGKVPPVCVERNLPHHLHLQVGYCP
jgi:hypothetical protein